MLGWEVNNLTDKLEIKRTTKETNISLVFKDNEITIMGKGDLEHHLIEDLMIVLNKLAELRGIDHKIIIE